MTQRNENHKIVVCVSGGGRSLRNLLEKEENYSYKVAGVVCSNPKSKSASIAPSFNLPMFLGFFPLEHQTDAYTNNAERLNLFLSEINPKIIVLAGFLRPFPVSILGQTDTNQLIINIHPSLLPHYGGKGMFGDKVHQAVLNSKDQTTGATVHHVTDVYDEGKVISQAKVKRLSSDTADTLSERVFEAEKSLLPITIDKLLRDELPLAGGKVFMTTQERMRNGK